MTKKTSVLKTPREFKTLELSEKRNLLEHTKPGFYYSQGLSFLDPTKETKSNATSSLGSCASQHSVNSDLILIRTLIHMYIQTNQIERYFREREIEEGVTGLVPKSSESKMTVLLLS